MNLRRLFLTLAPAALLLGLSATASAAVIANGSVAFSGFVVSYTGANLANATTVTLAVDDPDEGTKQGGITDRQGNFKPVAQGGLTPVALNSAVAIGPLTFNVPAFPLTIQFGSGLRFSFTSSFSTKSNITANDLTIYATGTFSDANGYYSDGPASLIMSLTQSGGPGNSVSLSGTIVTPPAFTLVPEPATMALMGSALIGVALLGRKKLVNR